MQRIVETLELVNGLPDQQAGPAQQAFLATLYEEGTLMFAGPFTTTAVAVPPSRAVTPSRKLGPSTKRVP